jgi:hypothetical protein
MDALTILRKTVAARRHTSLDAEAGSFAVDP